MTSESQNPKFKQGRDQEHGFVRSLGISIIKVLGS